VEDLTRKGAEPDETLNARDNQRQSGVDDTEDRLRLVIESIPVMVWSVRADGVVDFLNRRWLDYTGLSLEDAIQAPTGTVHPDDLPKVLQQWTANMAAGEAYEAEMRLRGADGTYRWFLVRTAPLRDENGTIVKWFGSSIDIEERRRAEKQLRDAHRQLRVLSRRRLKAHEEQRRKFASEVGDQMGKLLAVAETNLQVALNEPNQARSKRILETSAILQRLLSQVRTSRSGPNGETERTGSGVDLLEQLTPRQRETLQLIGEGKNTKEIAANLKISIKTVEAHRLQLMQRLHIHDLAGLVRFAIRTGLVSI
jgi:PAS domain S-box-containing protein